MMDVGLSLLFWLLLIVGVALLAFVLVRVLVGGLAPSGAERGSTRSARAPQEES